jgi:hypothetical protein
MPGAEKRKAPTGVGAQFLTKLTIPAKSSLARLHLQEIQGDTREEKNDRLRSRTSAYQYGVLAPKGRFSSDSF